jgi:hypothetical protein
MYKLKFITLFVVLFATSWTAQQNANAQGAVSFQVFYDELSPYGTWVNAQDYGYVWVPSVGSGFEPYSTNGYWAYTDNGWTWVSNYPWGWAPFHYGRWYDDPAYGPVWVPDNVWGPGWVTWRRSANYYGWCPIRPGMSAHESNRRENKTDHHRWTFVRSKDLGQRNLHNYYVNPSRNEKIINSSTVISRTHVDKNRNATYNAGPDRAEAEKRSGKSITPVTLRDNPKPGEKLRNNRLQIYKPRLQENNAAGTKAAPNKVATWEEVKARPKTPVAAQQPAAQPVQQKPQQPQRIKQSPRQQPAQLPQDKPAVNNKPRPISQPAKQQPAQQQRARTNQHTEGEQNLRPQKSQPAQQQPIRQQPAQQQPLRQQPEQPQRARTNQHTEGEQNLHPQNGQPARQKPDQQQQNQRQNTPREIQQRPSGQPARQQPNRQAQPDPHQKPDGEKHYF